MESQTMDGCANIMMGEHFSHKNEKVDRTLTFLIMIMTSTTGIFLSTRTRITSYRATNLFTFVSLVICNFSRGLKTDFVYNDCFKALNCVDHAISIFGFQFIFNYFPHFKEVFIQKATIHKAGIAICNNNHRTESYARSVT